MLQFALQARRRHSGQSVDSQTAVAIDARIASSAEAKQFRRDLATCAASIAASSRGNSGSGANASGDGADTACGPLPISEGLLDALLCDGSAAMPAGCLGGTSKQANRTFLSEADFGIGHDTEYIVAWRSRLLHVLAAQFASSPSSSSLSPLTAAAQWGAATDEGSGGNNNSGVIGGHQMPAPAKAAEPFFTDLLAVLLETYRRRASAGRNVVPFYSPRDVQAYAVSDAGSEGGGGGEVGSSGKKEKMRFLQRPQLMCYRRLHALHVSVPSSRAVLRGAFPAMDAATAATCEAASIEYQSTRQKYGMCKTASPVDPFTSSSASITRRPSTSFTNPSAPMLTIPNSEGSGVGPQKLPPALLGRRDSRTSAGSHLNGLSYGYEDQPASPDEGMGDDPHPLFALNGAAATERERLRLLFAESSASVSKALSTGAEALRRAGVSMVRRRESFCSGISASSASKLEQRPPDWFGYDGLVPSPMGRAAPILRRLARSVGEAQRLYDDALMAFF